MSKTRFVVYYRVSTKKQGRSGLGLDAQATTVESYLKTVQHEISDVFTEIESGGNGQRPELGKAIKSCKLKNAVLLIARLDRLSRDLHFITALQKAGIKFVCCDLPSANELTIHVVAAVAEQERRLISERTKAALREAKKRGVKLGNPGLALVRNNDTRNATARRSQLANDFTSEVWPIIQEIMLIQGTGSTRIAGELNARGYCTRRGMPWNATAVSRLISRKPS